MEEDKLIDLRELYHSRVVVMVETAPQSNKYYQVMLTKEQFNQISTQLYLYFGGRINEEKPVTYLVTTDEF